MGFNNDGVDAFVANVQARALSRGVLGLNIGKNADTPIERAADDYLDLPRTRLSARELRDDQHLVAEHEEPARSCRAPRQLDALLAALQGASSSARRQHGELRAARAEDRARPRRRADRCDRRTLAAPPDRRRDRDQHHDRARRRRGPAARRRSRRPVGRAGVRRVEPRDPQAARRTLGDDVPIIGVGGIMSRRRCAREARGGRRRSCRSTPA